MIIYICSIEELNDAASYDAASLKIDSYRRNRLSFIKSEKDKMRSLCAGLLLNYAVAEYKKECLPHGISLIELSLQELLDKDKQEYEYKQDQNEKPYISDMSGFYFSLSHSEDYVLCACDRREIGADLQCMDREVKETLAKKVMTEDEYGMYVGLSKQKQREEFYRIWTIKESYSKLTGKGLAQDFRDIETKKIFCHTQMWKNNYWLAVCNYE